MSTCHRLAVSEGGTGNMYSGWPIKKSLLLFFAWRWRQPASETFQHWANILILWYQTTLTFDSEPMIDILVLIFFHITFPQKK